MSQVSLLHIYRPSVYEYKGWKFETHLHGGAWPLKKDGEPRKRAGLRFWNVWKDFCSLPGRIQEQHHVAGAPHIERRQAA